MDRRRATLRGRIEGPGRPVRCGRPWWAGLGLLIAVLPAWPARAQDEVRNFRMPVLMVETGGHHARVRSLLWQDDLTLLSGGEDKVVKVWDFHEDPRLARSIRPMIWRGSAGSIYAMAISPRPDEQGQSFLAVAGYGIEARRGDITVFRVPGLVRTPTGEVVDRMLPPPDGQPQAIGHTDVVTCLAFNPSGRILASGSADATIILWDAPTPLAARFRARPPLRGHTLPIRSIAFSPDGRLLASGGADGSVRIWDVATGAQVEARIVNANPPNPINSLAFSPDSRSIVAGRESPGVLNVYQVGNLAQGVPGRLPTVAGQGPVECVAFHMIAGRPRLAVSIKSDASSVPDPLRISCDVEIRDMPAGTVVDRRRVPGLVYALAFSPDGRRLAYAGGHDQAIQIVDPAAPGQPASEIKGAGSTPFDVRFSGDGNTIGFTREAFDPANPPAIYQGFDLDRRAARTVARGELPHGAILQFQGWNLSRSTDPLRLVTVNANNGLIRAFGIDLRLERQAWSWTFIPGAASHPRATIAIGTEAGVAVYDFENGTRTRVYAGHSSPVVSLAPSSDGRWLASSSLDQTVLLYPLDGCDTRPPLGVDLRPRPDGSYVVQSADRGSFAAGMGLIAGDVLVDIGIAGGTDGITHYRTAAEMDEFLRILPSREPYLYLVGIKVRRTMLIPTVGAVRFEAVMPTSRRNNPALALFLGTDREWVLWTPQGYYDTSIEGDARFLGWHVNPPFQTLRPTDFVPIGAFAEKMNRRDLLEQLWRTGVLTLRAPQEPPPVVVAAEEQPPRIVFAAIQGGIKLPPPGVLWVVDRPNVPVSLEISASGKSEIRRRRILLDERPIEQDPEIGPREKFTEQVPLNGLVPNRQVRLAVEATNAAGEQRTETIDIVYLPPKPPPDKPMPPPPSLPPPPRLHLLAIGCDNFGAGLAPLTYAGRDAKDLADWLAGHLTSADGTGTVPQPPRILEGMNASARSITEACEHLNKLAQPDGVRKHDIVAVVIASHVLATPDGVVIAASDTVSSTAPRPAVAASDLGEILGRLTDYGCRVVVFLDGVHEVKEPLKSEIKPFVRDLQRKRGVITFIASKEGPSDQDKIKGHGFFALGVMQAMQGADLAGIRKDRTAAYTLDQFKAVFKNEVLNLSSRRQQADCFIPERVSLRTFFVIPRK